MDRRRLFAALMGLPYIGVLFGKASAVKVEPPEICSRHEEDTAPVAAFMSGFPGQGKLWYLSTGQGRAQAFDSRAAEAEEGKVVNLDEWNKKHSKSYCSQCLLEGRITPLANGKFTCLGERAELPPGTRIRVVKD